MILERLSIAELIGQTVSLKKRANRHVGLCPFHSEKTPSFTVFDNHYYCFGCRASGDAIDFVRKRQGTGFIETLQLLGEKCGVDTSLLTAAGKRGASQKHLVEIMSVAQSFFHQQIFSESAREAVAYLAKRGIETTDIRTYRIGYAPSDRQALCEHLKGQKISLETAVSLALLNKKGKDKWDFFSNRIMLPIYNAKGQIIGFAGRTLADNNEQIKYLNSRETSLFRKSSALFGLWHSARSIADKKIALVVEGYFDWLALRKAGFSNCVACMGTALTEQQLKLIKRYLNKVILIFDGDSAGIEAMINALKLAFVFPEIEIMVCLLPDKHDPDSYLRQHGTESFTELLTQAKNIVDVTITAKVGQATLVHLPEIIRKEIVPILEQLDDDVQRGALINKIAHDCGLNRQDFNRLLKKSRKLPTDSPAVPTIRVWVKELLGHMYHAQPQELNIETLDKFARQQLNLHPYLQMLWDEMMTNLSHGKCNHEQELHDPRYPEVIIDLLISFANDQPAYEGKNRDQKIITLINRHAKSQLQDKIALLQQQLNRATSEDEMQLLRELTDLRRESKT